MPSTPDVLRLDLSALRAAADGIVDVAGEVTAQCRRLRLPVAAPATDTVSLELAARCNHGRLRLALVGESAADELVRMTEYAVAAAYEMSALARRTQTAVMGLSVPPCRVGVVVAPPSLRDTTAAAEIGPEMADGDHDVLSFAVLVMAGADEVGVGPQPDAAAVRAAGRRLQGLAESVGHALSNGERVARTLNRFGRWIGHDFAGAVTDLQAMSATWGEEYARARLGCTESGRDYAALLAATIAGAEANPVSADTARVALARYRRVRFAPPPLGDHPRLGVAAQDGGGGTGTATADGGPPG